MKTTSIALTYTALALIFPAIALTPAQPPSSAPHASGLWRAPHDEGMPGVILTLADDSGRLIGGIVFNALSPNDGPSRISRHPHAILNLRVEGYTLRFVIIRRGDSLRGERPPA